MIGNNNISGERFRTYQNRYVEIAFLPDIAPLQVAIGIWRFDSRLWFMPSWRSLNVRVRDLRGQVARLLIRRAHCLIGRSARHWAISVIRVENSQLVASCFADVVYQGDLLPSLRLSDDPSRFFFRFYVFSVIFSEQLKPDLVICGISEQVGLTGKAGSHVLFFKPKGILKWQFYFIITSISLFHARSKETALTGRWVNMMLTSWFICLLQSSDRYCFRKRKACSGFADFGWDQCDPFHASGGAVRLTSGERASKTSLAAKPTRYT